MESKLVNVNQRKINHQKQSIWLIWIRTAVSDECDLWFSDCVRWTLFLGGRISPTISEAAACSSEHHQQSNLDLSSPPPQTMPIPSTNYSNGCTPDNLLFSYETSNPHHHFYNNYYAPSPPIKQLTSQFDYHHHHHHQQHQVQQQAQQQQQQPPPSSHYYQGHPTIFSKVKHENQPLFSSNEHSWIGQANFGVWNCLIFLFIIYRWTSSRVLFFLLLLL